MNSKEAPKQNGNMQGFTLLELIISISIFALLAAMAYSGLNNVLRAREITDKRVEQLVELQRTMMFLGRDIKQTINRPIRDENGEVQPALVGNGFSQYLIEFTRAGWSNLTQSPRSNLQRVAWSYREETLSRIYWRVLDRAQDSQPVKQTMLTGAEELTIRYLDSKREWHDSWPDAAVTTSAGDPIETAPKAVEVTIKHKEFGEIQRIFAIAG